MKTQTMELSGWGVTALGPEAELVVGGFDVLGPLVVGAVLYIATHLREFANGIRDGFYDAQ
jgi:hypothetical protein